LNAVPQLYNVLEVRYKWLKYNKNSGTMQ